MNPLPGSSLRRWRALARHAAGVMRGHGRPAGRLGVLLTSALLALAGGPRGAHAQTPTFTPLRADGGGVAALARRVDVVMDDVTVADAVRSVAQAAGVGYTYAPGLPDLDRRVTLRARGSSAAEALLRAVEGTGIAVLVSASGQIVLVRRPASSPAGATLRGYVRERDTGAPVPGARVRLVGGAAGALTVDDGAFLLPAVSPGTYAVEVSGLGFERTLVPAVRLAAGDSTPPLRVEVALKPVSLAAMVVAPGHFGVIQTPTQARATLTREQVMTQPQIGEDLFRSINRLPGVASRDLAAAFHVRGGGIDELYVSLDGMELYEPFHLKDFDAALSILDVQSVGGVDLTTGGFTAETGNRLTGVLDIRSVEPQTDRPRTALGVSLTGVRAQSQGGFAGGRGGWLLSGRRGYLDLALKMTNMADSISPRYYDVFGKVRYDLAPGQRVSLELLHAGDAIRFRDGASFLRSGYGSTYLWGTWQASLVSGLQLRTIASAAHMTWNRHGNDISLDRVLAGIDDVRRYNVFSLKHDASLELSPRLLLRAGGELRGLDTSYDYDAIIWRYRGENGRLRADQDSLDTVLQPAGAQVGAYAAGRMRLTPWAVAEVGGRFDRQGYTGEHQLSPRLNLVLTPLEGTTLRAAWGRYYQPQAAAGIQVQDGLSRYGPAERATHLVAGLEQRLGERASLRLEAYRRDLGPPRPRWLNLSLAVEAFPEVELSRTLIEPTGGRARGLELFGTWHGDRWEWSGSYALARVEDRIAGRLVPRLLDQEHTGYVDGAIRAGDGKWRLSWAWQIHSGWPEATVRAVVDTLRYDSGDGYVVRDAYDLPRGARLPWYHRVDLRATRYFDLAGGRLSLFGDLFNALNNWNAMSYEWNVTRISQNGIQQQRVYRRQIPRFVSLGVTWEF